ncbi:MAG: glycosyltransferase family 39 protein [Parcubacteria group bacterium]
MKTFLEQHYKKIVALIILFMATVSLLNAWNDSAIFDETAHIGASYSYVTQHEMRLNPEHPPLLKDLAGLSILLFVHPHFDVTDQAFWDGTLPGKWDEGQWAAGRYLLFSAGNDANKILFFARLPIVLLSLLFAWFIFFWVRRLAGTLAGLFALTLYAFDPNILGHNHFVTTDLGIAVFFAFAFYFYLKFVKDPTWKNVALAGVFLGLLQLTKFSFIVGLPILALATLIYPLTKKLRDGENGSLGKYRVKKLGEYIVKGFSLLIISLFVVWAFYFLNTFKMSKETTARSIDFNFPASASQSVKEATARKIYIALNTNAITRPLVTYGEGIGYVFRRVAGGNGAYFMGQVSSSAFRAYFPTVFAIKEPLINLFLMLLALAITLGRGGKFLVKKFSGDETVTEKTDLSDFIRHNIVSLSLFSFIILYTYVSITSNLNIGFRHLFPILPFIYILVAKVIFDFIKRLHHFARLIWYVIMAGLALFLVAGTIAAYPSYMSYFNQLADGPKNGFHYATDSNADWGQDLKRLKTWVDDYNNCAINVETCAKCCLKNNRPIFPEAFEVGPIEHINMNYFGGADTHYYFGDFAIDWWDSKRPIEPGWYALSTNFLMGSIYDTTRSDEESYRWVKDLKPVAQVGTSIFVYYVTPEEAAAAK